MGQRSSCAGRATSETSADCVFETPGLTALIDAGLCTSAFVVGMPLPSKVVPDYG